MTIENAQTVEHRVKALLEDQMGTDLGVDISSEAWATMAGETSFDKLGLDSLDKVELVMGLEDEFELEIQDDECATWRTIGDVLTFIRSKGIT